MKQFKNIIKKIAYDGHLELSSYYTINFKAVFLYYVTKFFNNKDEKIHLNFLITSNAELRIFKPIILSILNKNEFKGKLFYLSDFEFDTETYSKIRQSNNVSITNSIHSVIRSFKTENYLNIICLDHALYYWQHWIGVDIIRHIKKQGGKTVCIQHGGTQNDNIKGHIASESQNQIVFGKYLYNKLLANGLDKRHVFLTGNPLHDNVVEKLVIPNIDLLNINKNKVVTLISCLHTEYEDRENPEQCYLDYINKIYSSIDFSKYDLIVKMHPNDTINPNIYKNQLKQFDIDENKVLIVEPNNENNVYQYINISDLIISRSSTVMEESLLLKKKIIAFDLFEDGPSRYYDHLNKYPSYRSVIGIDKNLTKAIQESVEKDSFNEDQHKEIIEDFTYKLDNASVNRILTTFKTIVNMKLTQNDRC